MGKGPSVKSSSNENINEDRHVIAACQKNKLELKVFSAMPRGPAV